jgi:hypothetical protein
MVLSVTFVDLSERKKSYTEDSRSFTEALIKSQLTHLK